MSPLPDACAAITTGDIHTAGMLSGGAGSWGACRRWIDQHGTDGLVLLFTDVGGNPANAHTGEDPDTLRFLDDAAADLGAPLVKLRDGRDIWDVFWQKRWLGNTQVAHCSWELKTTPVRQWLEQNAPRVQRIIIGIDATEDHRAAGISAKYAPYQAVFPLMERPYLWKPQLLDMLRERGIVPPRMYRLGFAHANCRGCVKAGQGHWLRLLRVFPDEYAYAEAQEEKLRAELGDVAILRDRTGGETVPLTLAEFRRRADDDHGQIDLFEEGGCACF